MTTCLFLMRHGSIYREFPEEEQQQSLSYEGKRIVNLHGKILAETLKNLPENDDVIISEIWSCDYKHSIESAEGIQKIFSDQPTISRQNFLRPDVFLKNANREAFMKDYNRIEEFFSDNNDRSLLIVGHMPQLSWVLSEMTDVECALARGEILCIKVTQKKKKMAYNLVWSISETDEEANKMILEKIKAKMDMAKVLGAIITTGLGWILAYFLDKEKYTNLLELQKVTLGVSIVCFFLAIIFFVKSLYYFDSLSMPVRFWGEPLEKSKRKWKTVTRPPSSSLWILYQNMINIWNKIFKPAIWLTGSALTFLAISVFLRTFEGFRRTFQRCSIIIDPLIWVVLVIGTIIVVLWLFFHYFKINKPVFGSED